MSEHCQVEVVGQSTHTSNHDDAILRAFEANSHGAIPNSAYIIQSKVDAFLRASTAWKRGQLLDEFLRGDRAVLVTALACKPYIVNEARLLI
jgi:hypothetical protein